MKKDWWLMIKRKGKKRLIIQLILKFALPLAILVSILSEWGNVGFNVSGISFRGLLLSFVKAMIFISILCYALAHSWWIKNEKGE